MREEDTGRLPLLAWSVLIALVVTSCARSSGPCLAETYADLSGAEAYITGDGLPFRFPLDDLSSDTSASYTHYCASSSGPESARKYHAAEDYFRPAGTPVYAMADGRISFSGPMGGYGWLVIIDHPQANLYSLYGHLSPSRFRMKPGAVDKGGLIGYLGDSHENGGSLKRPLEPHLHLGMRAGQRADYPGGGEWRWQAGWIRPCPKELGWLQPSVIISGQAIPVGGFLEPAMDFVAKWRIEFLLGGLYVSSGICMLVFAVKKHKPVVPILSGITFLAAGWFFRSEGWRMSYALLFMGVLCPAIGVVLLVRRSRQPGSESVAKAQS